MRRLLTAIVVVAALFAVVAGTSLAAPSPNGPGLPASGGGDGSITCQNIAAANPGMNVLPGKSVNGPGSPFNSSGTSGGVYNPISEYDIACFQQSVNH